MSRPVSRRYLAAYGSGLADSLAQRARGAMS
jgi:hypothetical protein